MSKTDSPFSDLSELSIVEGSAVESGDPVFTSEQLDRMSNQMLRRLAAEANTDEINGKSTQLEIISFFDCQKSLDDF